MLHCYIPFLELMARHEVTKNPLAADVLRLTITSTIGSFVNLVTATIVMHILLRLKATISDLRCSSPVRNCLLTLDAEPAAVELLQLRVSGVAFSVSHIKFKLKLDLRIIICWSWDHTNCPA